VICLSSRMASSGEGARPLMLPIIRAQAPQGRTSAPGAPRGGKGRGHRPRPPGDWEGSSCGAGCGGRPVAAGRSPARG
jgi:hypothetical protein